MKAGVRTGLREGGLGWRSGFNVGMATDSGQFGGDGLRRQDEIHAAAVDGMLRHVRVPGGHFILGKRDPASRLDFGQSRGAVETGAGEEYANCPLLQIGSQRAEEAI